MSKLKIEKIGGMAGFGGKNSHLSSRGEIETKDLSHEDKKVVEGLFASQSKTKSTLARDTFRYRISRTTPNGTESIEAEEEKIPDILKQCVRDGII